MFPKLDNFRQSLYFLLKGIQAFIVAIIGVLMGKWWYGHLYNESVKLHYVDSLPNKALAEDYFFHHSNWFYKPLWCYEAEDKGSDVNLYFYSTNFENVVYNDYKMKEDHGLRIMTWNNFIVWDQEQENFFKRYCPNATFTQIGYLDFSGIEYIVGSKDTIKRLAVFDVTPARPAKYISLGFTMPPYYSEELNLKFLDDIIKVFYNNKWEILWKRKRTVDRTRISEAFNQKQLNLVKKKVTMIDPIVSAHSILLVSDAVISMPFTSTGIIGKMNELPSVYYDPSGKVKLDKSHDISVLKNISDLSIWETKQSENSLSLTG
jgi:polysaccharide biosynthesis PFTS motif protein